MPYYTGSAANMSQVRDAIVTACTANGWAWSDEVLAKGGIFIRLKIQSGHLLLRGQTNQSGAGLVGHDIGIGPYPHPQSPALTWPVTYHVFAFPHEIYFLMRYNVDVFQFVAMGKSTIAGLPGSGGWYSASGSGLGANGYVLMSYDGTNGYNRMPGAMFLGDKNLQEYPMYSGGYVDAGLDGVRWMEGRSVGQGFAAAPLMNVMLSEYSSESALIPIRAYQSRPEGKISLVLELQHSRRMNVANVEPEQIITLGSDRWMCFPWYRKAVSFGVANSGPLGWAIRYEGP